MFARLMRSSLCGLIVPILFLFALIAGCGGSSSSSSADKTVPTLVSTSPVNGVSNAPLNTGISAIFSENVTADSFTVASKQGIIIIGTVAGNGSNALSFFPSVPLNFGIVYTAKITNIRDGSGNKMADVSWSFTTSGEVLNYHTTPDSHYYDAGKFNSIAISPVDGKSYVSYFNATTRSLYVISTTDGTSFDGPYRVDGPSGAEKVGEYSSLAIDASGALHISYYHERAGLKYATAPDIAAAWNTVVVEPGLTPVGTHNAIAVDGAGKVHISYYDTGQTELRYATNAGGVWAREIVYGGLSEDNPGRYTSIKIGDGNLVHISFYDYHAAESNGNLMYAYGTFGNWSLRTLDSTGDVGEFSSLALYGGNVYITYNHVYPDGHRFIRIITNASGDWRHWDIIEVSRTANDAQSLTANPLFIDTTGMMHISFYKAGVLYYATGVLYDIGLNSWEWSTSAVDTSQVGQGIYTSIAVDANGKANVAYYDATDGDLKFAE